MTAHRRQPITLGKAMIVRLNPAARIIPPSDVIGNRWVAENLLARRRYNISRTAATALVASARPQELDELVKHLADAGSDQGSPGYWEQVVESLRQHDLIIDADQVATEPRLDWLVNLRRDWSQFGWDEAAEYHTLSFDY